MTRDQAHPLPSNAHRSPREYSLPERSDPGYDQHRPLSRGDVGELVRAIPAAVVLLAGLWAAAVLLIAIVPGPR